MGWFRRLRPACRHETTQPFRFNPDVVQLQRDVADQVVSISGATVPGAYLWRAPVPVDESDGEVCARCDQLFIRGYHQ